MGSDDGVVAEALWSLDTMQACPVDLAINRAVSGAKRVDNGQGGGGAVEMRERADYPVDRDRRNKRPCGVVDQDMRRTVERREAGKHRRLPSCAACNGWRQLEAGDRGRVQR